MYTFEYNGSSVYEDELELDELGQVSLEAISSLGTSYYLIIRTLLGQSSIIEYGPLKTGKKFLPQETQIRFSRIEFKEGKIRKIIENFLAPRERGQVKILEVNVIDLETALDRGVDIIDYMRHFGEETNY